MNANLERDDALTEEQGQILVRLARQSIAAELGQPPSKEDQQTMERCLQQDIFQIQCGTFVTLKMSQRLRGCIGHLMGLAPLAESIRENALNAAFRDPRFSPLTIAEFSRVCIDISILSHPTPISYTDANNLVEKLRPQIDGVILRKGAASATFLPQVWENLPKPEDFLSQLCLKAGLSEKEWQKLTLEISVYQVQYFEEKSAGSKF